MFHYFLPSSSNFIIPSSHNFFFLTKELFQAPFSLPGNWKFFHQEKFVKTEQRETWRQWQRNQNSSAKLWQLLWSNDRVLHTVLTEDCAFVKTNSGFSLHFSPLASKEAEDLPSFRSTGLGCCCNSPSSEADRVRTSIPVRLQSVQTSDLERHSSCEDYSLQLHHKIFHQGVLLCFTTLFLPVLYAILFLSNLKNLKKCFEHSLYIS